MAKEIIRFDVDQTDSTGYDWSSKTLSRLLAGLAEKGATQKEIAETLGIKLNTLNRRLRQSPELEAVLLEGRSKATQSMVAKLYETAMGGKLEIEIEEKVYGSKKTTKITTRESQPNPQLMVFWLTNQDPENWRQYRDVVRMNKDYGDNTTILESDKIARLSRVVFEGHPDGTDGEHRVPQETAQPVSDGTVDAADVSPDVCGEAADSLQDDVLDIPTETGTEPL